MARLELPCPQCGRRLKVPDLSLLGRKARCGKCGHKFVMRRPEAEGVPPPTKTTKLVGPGSWEAPLEFTELADIKAGKPLPSAEKRPAARIAASPIAEPTENLRGPSAPLEFPTLEPDESGPFERVDLLPSVDSDEDFLSRRTYRSSTAVPPKMLAAVFGLLLLAVGVTSYFALARPKRAAPSAGNRASARTVAKVEAGPPDDDAPQDERRAGPPHGQPLTLRYVPMGARIVVHLRPADLWEPGSAGEEFRACLGPLGTWFEAQIKALCLVEPAKIEEGLFALIPTGRETFDVAAVVTTRREVKRSELLDKINGELIDQPRPHYVNEKNAYLIPDARTIAIVPRELADLMLEAVQTGGAASEGIEALLPKTDRHRHFTLLAELEDVRNGASSLAPENARSLLTAIVDFFGDHVETVAASIHLGDADADRDLFAQVLARNRVTRSPPHLRDDLQAQLAQWPADMLQVVYRTNPKQRGEKKVIGRFPIMTKVVERSAVLEPGRRVVALEWRLPERAGPNLALGALLTWNQTTLSDYGRSPASPPGERSNSPGLPRTIAERLQKKIDVEFRDDFLYVAIAFIGEEIGVEFKLDGSGMKRAGITQNEKQKFTMEKAPAIAVLERILGPRKLVLIVDEQKKIATITGAEDAADKKLQPFPLKPAGGK